MKQGMNCLVLPPSVVVLTASEGTRTVGGNTGDIILTRPDGTVAVGLLQVTCAALLWIRKSLLD
jgi:hypothetical protein